MSNLIVYKSNTGFTKSYVDMLERRVLPCEVVEISKLKKEQLKEAEYIFYGGPLKNNVIEGLDKFLKHYKLFEDKNVFIFCTGIQPIDQEKKENVITANGLEFYHIRLYLLPGGMDFSKMSPLKQKMIKFGLKAAAKSGKMPAGVSPEMIESRLTTPINLVNSNALDRMVEVYHMCKLRPKNNWLHRNFFH